MEFHQRISLEAVAIALFESFLRQQTSEGRGASVKDWFDLEPEERTEWRKDALTMVREDFE